MGSSKALIIFKLGSNYRNRLLVNEMRNSCMKMHDAKKNFLHFYSLKPFFE